MTKQEIAKLLMITASNFPSMQEKDLKPTRELWSLMLADIPYEIAERAVVRVLTTARFFPAVSEIREAVYETIRPKKIGSLQAWEQIRKAVRDYGYNRPEDAYRKMDPEVADAVRAFGYLHICQSENTDVTRAHFIKLWEEMQKDNKTYEMQPGNMKYLIEDYQRKILTEGQKQIGAVE